MTSNITPKVKEIYSHLVRTNKHYAARRLLRLLWINQNHKIDRLPIRASNNEDWVIAQLFDPNHNGFSYLIR